MSNHRWDIGGGYPAVHGGAMSAVRVADRPANDRPGPILSVDGRACVHLAERVVRLQREMPSGLRLGVTVPLDAYKGLTVDVLIDTRAVVTGYSLILAHADPRYDVVLLAAPDDTDLVASWRGLSRRLGLPLLMRTDAGDTPAEQRLGALTVHPYAPRRAPRAFLKRRPNGLRRRQMPLRPVRTA